MNPKVRSWLGSMALASAIVLAACSSGGNTTGGGTTATAVPAAPTTLNITTEGEQLKFSPTTLSASANQATTVNFQNPSASQQHNWVLVKGGNDVATKVAQDSTTAAPSFIPRDPEIVASVKLLDP